MAARLSSLFIEAPGVFGLNTQNPTGLDAKWATAATNVTFDAIGRLSARKGWINSTTTPMTGTPAIEQIAEYLRSSGSIDIISAANLKIYKGVTSFTELTGITLPTANNWKMVNFRDKMYGFQRAHKPWNYNGTTIADLADANAPQANEVLAAFGRLWAADTATTKVIIKYSALLNGEDWTTASDAGNIDLDEYLAGTDSIVALREYNGFLVVFCENTILVFSGADDPNAATFALVETIKGIGCVARDVVQDIGTDLLFLSDDGLRSLGRTIQEKSMPFRDLSANVRNYMKTFTNSESDALIRSVYHPHFGFYLLILPSTKTIFCFDTRTTLPDGSYRTTVWDSIDPRCAVYTHYNNTHTLYFGKTGGILGRYEGYSDNGATYFVSMRSPWIDFGDASVLKFLKKMKATILGGQGYNAIFKWSFDYLDSEYAVAKVLSSYTASEWNIAEYNIGEYSGGALISTYDISLSKSGNVVKFGFDLDVNGAEFALQAIRIYATTGKVL